MKKIACLLLLALALGLMKDASLSYAASDKENPVQQLEKWLETPRKERVSLTNTPFAVAALSREQADKARQMLWADHEKYIRATRGEEMKAGVIELNGFKMQLGMVAFGNPTNVPAGGRSLFISMHGGGGAPTAVNDSQWKNQIRLGKAYAPKEGIYVAPRAPTDAWNLWHQDHIDRFFDRLIENLVVLSNVNPDRVYIMGYSAGGDGVYQLGPRMADRWAAAAMMAGHPNEASPLGLRNVPFCIQVGELDGGFKRNQVAGEWGRKLVDLQKADPEGYIHYTELHKGKSHWMDLEDRKAIPWMEKYTRNPYPERVVWFQDDVTHDRFYWLAVPAGSARKGQEIIVERKGPDFRFKPMEIKQLSVMLNDDMLSLDHPVTVRIGGGMVYSGLVQRNILNLWKTLEERGDKRLVFSAIIPITVP